MRGLVAAWAVGIVTGVLVAWEAGRRWERAAWAWSWAVGWLSEAVWLAREAAGWIVGVVVVLGMAGVLAWWVM